MDSYRRVYGAGGLFVFDAAVDSSRFELARVDMEEDALVAYHVRVSGGAPDRAHARCCCGADCVRAAADRDSEVPPLATPEASIVLDGEDVSSLRELGFRDGDILGPVDSGGVPDLYPEYLRRMRGSPGPEVQGEAAGLASGCGGEEDSSPAVTGAIAPVYSGTPRQWQYAAVTPANGRCTAGPPPPMAVRRRYTSQWTVYSGTPPPMAVGRRYTRSSRRTAEPPADGSTPLPHPPQPVYSGTPADGSAPSLRPPPACVQRDPPPQPVDSGTPRRRPVYSGTPRRRQCAVIRPSIAGIQRDQRRWQTSRRVPTIHRNYDIQRQTNKLNKI